MQCSNSPPPIEKNNNNNTIPIIRKKKEEENYTCIVQTPHRQLKKIITIQLHII